MDDTLFIINNGVEGGYTNCAYLGYLNLDEVLRSTHMDNTLSLHPDESSKVGIIVIIQGINTLFFLMTIVFCASNTVESSYL